MILSGYGIKEKKAKAYLFSPFISNSLQKNDCVEINLTVFLRIQELPIQIYHRSNQYENFK